MRYILVVWTLFTSIFFYIYFKNLSVFAFVNKFFLHLFFVFLFLLNVLFRVDFL